MNTIRRCRSPAQYFRVSIFLSRFLLFTQWVRFIILLPGGFCYCSLSLFTSLRASRIVPALNTATLVTSCSMNMGNSKFRFSQKAAAVQEVYAYHSTL